MVKKINPGSITHLQVDENSTFIYLFLAFGPSIRGLSCMRKVFAIDGTFLKTCYKGCLLVATAQDGNRHCYPIAWAVVDSENDASWTWFLTKLQEIIPDNDDLVFIRTDIQASRMQYAIFTKMHIMDIAYGISNRI